MLGSKAIYGFAAALAFVACSTCSSELSAQSPSVSSRVVSVSAKKCRCGRQTCTTCQQQRFCEPCILPPTDPMQFDQPPAILDAPLAPEAQTLEAGDAPQTESFNFSDAEPVPSATSATNLFAANRAAGAQGAFGSSLLGATTPEMMGDFFGPGGVPSVFVRGSNTFSTPVPGAGNALGRMKLAENNSPNPRDRVFFNYSLFTGVPLATDPITVNRFSPGFEKTFLDGMASIELRAPFGTSLDTNIFADGMNSNSEFQFGNLFLSLKGVLVKRENWLLTAGSSILLPTASDTRIIDPQSDAEFLRFENDSVRLMPFIGGAYVPNARFFSQWIVQTDFALNGNPVIATSGTTETQIGTLQDSTLLYTDLSFGYWVYKACESSGKCITGIAPIAELHYNRALNNGDTVSDANISVVQTIPELDNLNAQVGLIFNLRDRSRLGFGYATPMGNHSDRVFDNELRVTFNRYF